MEEIREIKAVIKIETNKRTINEQIRANSLWELKNKMAHEIEDLQEIFGDD